MDLTYTVEDLNYFISDVYFPEIETNGGGMGIIDMFTFHFLLKRLKPKLVIESGVWNGISTKLIRKTLGSEVKILCLDPLDLRPNGFKDTNPNTYYFIDKTFIDFNDIKLTTLNIGEFSNNEILCFFDDHQNSAQRLHQCIIKDMKHVFFNDNYPLMAGSHYSIQHLIDFDPRKVFDIDNQYSYSINKLPQISIILRDILISKIKKYIVFPNVFECEIDLYEGKFKSTGYFKDSDFNAIEKYSLFYKDRKTYCWNTYILIE
jgi:hypothetical protein